MNSFLSLKIISNLSQSVSFYSHHFYRINNFKEILDIGIYDYIDSKSICFIEWGDLIMNRIKTSNHIIDINIISDTKREISFK